MLHKLEENPARWRGPYQVCVANGKKLGFNPAIDDVCR